MKPRARSSVAPAWVACILLCAASAAWMLLSSSRAEADTSSADAAATALFDEGRKLMAQHRYADACPKLADSQRLAPSGGTLINLAECYEHTGQTASAWVAWKDAAARANAAGKAGAEKNALDRAALLEPKLARLSIVVAAESDVAGLEVKRDGIAVGHAEFGLPIPVDPGSHLVEARAPKKKPWSSQVDVTPKQTDARVTVSLADDTEARSASSRAPAASANAGMLSTGAEAPATQAQGSSTQKTIAWVVLGAGVVCLGVGTVFGLQAKSKNDEALQPNNCPTSMRCTQNGLNLTDDAKSAATIATIGFVAGGVALGAGAVLWITAPSTSGVYVAPSVGLSFQGATLAGRF